MCILHCRLLSISVFSRLVCLFQGPASLSSFPLLFNPHSPSLSPALPVPTPLPLPPPSFSPSSSLLVCFAILARCCFAVLVLVTTLLPACPPSVLFLSSSLVGAPPPPPNNHPHLQMVYLPFPVPGLIFLRPQVCPLLPLYLRLITSLEPRCRPLRFRAQAAAIDIPTSVNLIANVSDLYGPYAVWFSSPSDSFGTQIPGLQDELAEPVHLPKLVREWRSRTAKSSTL